MSDTITLEDLGDGVYPYHQFATIIFEREEDEEKCLITVASTEGTRTFIGDNSYNPSSRRRGTSIYVRHEGDSKNFFKITIKQHKGETILDIEEVDKKELLYFFTEKYIKSFYNH